MSVEVKGLKELEDKIEKRFGKKRMTEISNKALEEATDYEMKILKSNFEKFKDTGASIDEMTRTDPFTSKVNYQQTIIIEWVGPHDRYRLIHLNEHGYNRKGGKFIPRGFGVIEKTLQSVKRRYRQIIKEEMRKRLWMNWDIFITS